MDITATNTRKWREFRALWETDQKKWWVRI